MDPSNNAHRQYLACRRNERSSVNALRFEARQEENLLALRDALVARTDAPTRSVCFFAPGPKLREVFAADFSDRVVHHALVDDRPGFRRYRFDEARLDLLHATLSSYLGHCKMAGTHNLWQSLWARNAWLARYFTFDADARKLVRTYKAPRGFERAVQQYRYYRWRFRRDVVLFQVGRFFEFYARADAGVARCLGLPPMAPNARGARYGFPLQALARHTDVLLAAKRAVVVILQSDDRFTRIRHRVAAYRLEPATWAANTLDGGNGQRCGALRKGYRHSRR